ncbi:MAG: aldose epimerase family protein [Clostridia bacterium]|nr:aldose epimerase family protein [Clostridia bacterium]
MKKELFGSYNGADVYRYTLDNGIIKMCILNWGCVIQKLIFDGVDVECGFDTFDEYAACRDYYGSTIGRYANRIANAKLKFNDKEYILPINDLKTNCNHGGPEAFNRKIWDAKEIESDGCDGIEFTRISPDGENGFPGNLSVKVTFMLEGDSVSVRYEAETDADTVVNMTNHSYFNINGFDSGVILEHTLKVNADELTELDPLRRVTGKKIELAGTALDLSDGPKIGERIDAPHPQLEMIGGYGHNYIIAENAPKLSYKGRELSEHCVYACDARSMTVYSDKPCLQVYTANRIGGHSNFKGNTPVIQRSAVCLEPQYEPDSCNTGKYILHPGERYDYVTLYKFAKK